MRVGVNSYSGLFYAMLHLTGYPDIAENFISQKTIFLSIFEMSVNKVWLSKKKCSQKRQNLTDRDFCLILKQFQDKIIDFLNIC